MTMQATATTTPSFSHVEGLFTIQVEKLGENSYYPSVLESGEIVWSGALTSDPVVARHAAIRQYHLVSGDLKADQDRVIKINPLLLVPHPKNRFVYESDEETTKLFNQLNTEEGVEPYVSVYIVLEDGTIISGHRRNYVITEQVNPLWAKQGVIKIPVVPAIVRKYASEADELEALVKENQYRENKSRVAILNEAAVLLQVEKLRARERQAQAKRVGESVPKSEQGRSIRIVAERLNMKATDLQNQLSVDNFLRETITNPELRKLWQKVGDQSTHATVQLRQIWERDREREGLTDAHFVKACEIMLAAGKSKTNASDAITQAKRAIAEEENKKKEAARPANKGSGAVVAPSPGGGGAVNSSSSSGGGGGTVNSSSSLEEGGGTSTADQEASAALEAELKGMHPESRDRWIAASEAQRQTWRLAKKARDEYGDVPTNNRLSKRTELVDRCLQVIDRDRFDYDPFADLTNPNHIPCTNYYTVEDDFLKKEEGKYVNPISGDVFANILWNLQKDCVLALNYWIESGDVKRLFVVSQASIVNLPSCQAVIKKHGMVTAAWSGRLEYEAGEILSHDCYFPREGAPKKISEGNQRYDTVVLFYTTDPEEKLRFEAIFSPVALVTFQKEMVATAALDSAEYIKRPVWVANECMWLGYRLRVELGSEGIWSTFVSEVKEGADEEESESFGRDSEAKAFLMSLVLIKEMEKEMEF